MELVLLWIAFAVAIGVAANARGRSGVGWFFLAVVVSPLIAGFLVAVLPSLRDGSAGPRRPCPFCAEPVLQVAKVCPHCRSQLPAYEAPKAPEQAGWVLRGTILALMIAALAAMLWMS
jgi:hypothetical protein